MDEEMDKAMAADIKSGAFKLDEDGEEALRHIQHKVKE